MRRAVALALLLLPVAAQDDFARVKELISQLGDKDEQTRVRAALELGRLGPRAKGAASALVRAMGDESSSVAACAFVTLKKIGPDAVPPLVKALSSNDEAVRARAIRLIDECYARDVGPHLRTIAGLLKDRSPVVRKSAAHALGQQGEPVIEILLPGLGAREEGAQEAAIEALTAVGLVATGALVKTLTSGGDRARSGAARALGMLKAQDAGKQLLAALDDKVPEVGGAAALALGQANALPDVAIPRLLHGLSSANAAFREGCIDGLVAYGEPARAGLAAALESDDTRAAASLAILRSGEAGLATVQEVLGGASVVSRHAALSIARHILPMLVSDEVLAAVVGCLKHESVLVRADAARTLGGLGPRAQRKELTEAATDADPAVRAAAVHALGALGVDPGRKDDKDPVVRVEALLASWRTGGASGAEDLAKIALDAAAEPRVRAAAIGALGEMGIAATTVDLTPLVADQPVEIRRAAVEAIGRITCPSALAIRDWRAAVKRDAAVEASLAWLAEAQGADGEWEKGTLTAGTSGLALLAFLASGRGPGDADHGLKVRRGLSYLISKQDKKRGILSSTANHEYVLCHGIATVALIEGWILGGGDECRRAAQRAIDFIAWARNPQLAWRYEPRGGENDTHITVWMTWASRLGDAAGLRVDRDAYAGAAAWIEQMTGAEGCIGYNYPGGMSARPEGRQETFPADRVEPMTAAGLWCRQLVGVDLKNPLYRKGIGLLLDKPPSWTSGNQDLIYWSFGALALYQDGDATYGKWEKSLSAALNTGRTKSGAFAMDEVWADDGGQIYTTAMGVLTHLTPSRYPRDFLAKPKLSAATRSALAALKKACADEDTQVREIAAAACARLGG